MAFNWKIHINAALDSGNPSRVAKVIHDASEAYKALSDVIAYTNEYLSYFGDNTSEGENARELLLRKIEVRSLDAQRFEAQYSPNFAKGVIESFRDY